MRRRSPFPHNAGVFAAVIASFLLLTAMLSPSLATAQSWPIAGHDLSDTRSQPNETIISPTNVSQLAPRWVFTTHGDVSATPTVSSGVVYFPDWGGFLYAVRAGNGKLIWSHRISDYNGTGLRNVPHQPRGLSGRAHHRR
jgi:polyvinyl alcohol dehydrogenase (cytochrome)